MISLIFLMKMKFCSFIGFNPYCFVWHLALSNKNLGYINTKSLEAIQSFFFYFHSFALNLHQKLFSCEASLIISNLTHWLTNL